MSRVNGRAGWWKTPSPDLERGPVGRPPGLLDRDSGGPPDLDMLQDLEELKIQFRGLEIEHAVEREVDLSESGGHRGLAMINEFVASKL